MKLSILYFSSNFTGLELQWFSVFELSWSILVTHQKAPNQAKDFIKEVRVTLEGLWIVFDRIIKSRFFVKFHTSGPAIIFCFWTIMEHVSYPSNKLLKISDTIVKSRFFVKFHKSGTVIIFSFSTIMEHVRYPSKKLLIKPKTSSRWWVLLRMDYGWFLIELSNLDFSSNFTVPDLKNFSVFELSWSTLVIH